MLIKLLHEYGFKWVFFRFIYAIKLKVLSVLPNLDVLFEKKTKVSNVDIFKFQKDQVESKLINMDKDSKSKLIMLANNAIEGKIVGFSSINLDYGNPINWQINPLTGIETNINDKWFKISDFDTKRGDIKLVWEISRFTHFYLFLQSYMITKNKKYYYAFSKQLSEWLKNNPYSYGANYKCGQEATLRLINTLIVYSGFKAYNLTEHEDENNVKKLLTYSYKKVLSNYFYAYKCIRNNHTITETIGLIIGAFSESNSARLNRAVKKLNKIIDYQFSDDGGYIQNSFNYQRFVLQLLGFIESEQALVNPSISDKNKQKIINSIKMLYDLQDNVNGYLPNYGANDGALIFPFSQCDFRDYRCTINSLYYIFKGKRLYKNGEFDDELVWFSSVNSINEVDELGKDNIQYPVAGIFVNQSIKYKVIIVNKPYKSRPTHFDNLHLDLWINGVNVFKDSGSYSYSSRLGKDLRLVDSHNTVKVDDRQPMKIKPPFLVYDWVKNVKNKYHIDSYIGEYCSQNGYKHKRKIDFLENKLMVKDNVYGDCHSMTSILITEFKPQDINNGIKINIDNDISVNLITKNKIKISKSYVSDYYYEKKEAYRIEIGTELVMKHGLVEYEIIINNKGEHND